MSFIPFGLAVVCCYLTTRLTKRLARLYILDDRRRRLAIVKQYRDEVEAKNDNLVDLTLSSEQYISEYIDSLLKQNTQLSKTIVQSSIRAGRYRTTPSFQCASITSLEDSSTIQKQIPILTKQAAA